MVALTNKSAFLALWLGCAQSQAPTIISTVVTGVAGPFQLGPDGTGGFYAALTGSLSIIRGWSNGSYVTAVSGLASAAWGGAAANGTTGFFYDSGVNRILFKNALATRAVAGNGTAGYAGDGGPGSLARINAPYGMCSDGSGGLFLGDTFNHVVRRIFANGTIITYAGKGTPAFSGDGGPATMAGMHTPEACALESSSGSLLVAEVRFAATPGLMTCGT